MAHAREDWVGALFGLVVVLPIAVSLCTAGVVLGWQCFEWSRLAVWPTVTLRDALNWWAGHATRGEPSGWLGLDRIIGWLLEEVPLVLWLAVILPATWLSAGLWVFNRLLPPRGRP